VSLHEQCLGATDEWYTPPYVFDALDCVFDMDVAHPGEPHAGWIPAAVLVTRMHPRPWRGFIWMNPPFGGRNGIAPWLERFAEHANGIALAPDRTSAPWWQTYARRMDALLFVSPKIKFIGGDGQPGASPAQGTTLMALGRSGMTALRRASIAGLGVMVS
jgi:hypothetical protein